MAGLSLIELMVAMLISLLLMAGVIQIFSGTKNTFLAQEGNSHLQENARFALGRITADVSAAGYLGCMDSETPKRPFVNDLKSKVAGSVYDFSAPIFGTEGTGAGGSDTIVIHRAGSQGGIRLLKKMDDTISPIELDSTSSVYGFLKQFDLLVVGDCGTSAVFMITNDPSGSGGTIEHASGVTATTGSNIGQENATGDLQNVFGADGASVASATRVGTTTYAICNSMSGNGTSLFLNSNNCANRTEANELVEGVQDMQFLYGVDTNGTPGVDQYLRADQIGVAIWNQVVAVRMTLVLNTVQNIPGGMYNKSFTTTVRLRNRGG